MTKKDGLPFWTASSVRASAQLHALAQTLRLIQHATRAI